MNATRPAADILQTNRAARAAERGTNVMLKAALIALSLAALAPLASAQTPTAAPPAAAAVAQPSAATVLAAAKKQASDTHKQVLVVFHASWCGWCKRLDANLLNDPTMGKVISDQYVVVHLDVMENKDKKGLENPGADTLMTTLGGAKAGLPFYAVLDAKGNKLTDSLRMPKGENIGYPGSPAEIAAFTDMLKTTAKRMPEADRQKIADHLTKNAPKS